MRKPIAISLVALLVASAIWTGWGLREALRSAQPVQELSKMRHIGQVAATELTVYYRSHAGYPASLHELNLSAEQLAGEEATPRDLARFAYQSDGDAFSMVWPHPKYGFKISGSGAAQTFELLHPSTAASAIPPTNSWRLLQNTD